MIKKYLLATTALLLLASLPAFADSASTTTVQPHLFDDLNNNHTSDLAEGETDPANNVVDEVQDIELPPTPE